MNLVDTGSIAEHAVPSHQGTHVVNAQYSRMYQCSDTYTLMILSQVFHFSLFDLESGYHHIDIYEPL